MLPGVWGGSPKPNGNFDEKEKVQRAARTPSFRGKTTV